ncbi:MAG TPA: acyl-CoA dehydrogenase [Sneathiellales bacterium]|nr:acyl-CoA dehydrogenase [Sneathiellales bacterium]
MAFEFSDRVQDLHARMTRFMDEHVYPNDAEYYQQLEECPANNWEPPPLLEGLKEKAQAEGLWNLFLPKEHEEGAGLTNLEYAPLCEIMGRSIYAPEIFNCSAPDTGNMEVFAKYGTPEQKKKYLRPLLDGTVRSAFVMTEPAVASSDATNLQTTILPDGDDYVINGRKWFISGILAERCEILIVMGKSDPDAPKHQQQSMIVVHRNTLGVNIIRPLPVFHDLEPQFAGHSEVEFVNVRVPKGNILLGEGRGFEIAQGRLGPGRIHHCMRLIGQAELALELMCKRASSRMAFGKTFYDFGTIRADIAESRIEIDQARLLTLDAADKMDRFGNKVARNEIAMIKVVAPRMAQQVFDRAIQVHGAMGVTNDTHLPRGWIYARFVRIADGPDEVHREAVTRNEMKKYVN